MFHDATQAKLGKDLVCPKCHGFNVPHAAPTVRIDLTATRAECSQCSFEAMIEKFQPKEAR